MKKNALVTGAASGIGFEFAKLLAGDSYNLIWQSPDHAPLDVLINNAGYGLYGFFTQTDWKKEEEMINLHVMCLTKLTIYPGQTLTKFQETVAIKSGTKVSSTGIFISDPVRVARPTGLFPGVSLWWPSENSRKRSGNN